METVTLSNGLKVANFSSPHPFTFVDGSILNAVSKEDSEKLEMHCVETPCGDYDITIEFMLTEPIHKALAVYNSHYLADTINIVIVPLPLLLVLRKNYGNLKNTPFRSIRTANRFTKEVCIDKFCI